MKKYKTTGRVYASLYEALGQAIKTLKRSRSGRNCFEVWNTHNDTIIAIVTDDADGITCHRLRPQMNVDQLEAADWDKIAQEVSVSR
jgi:hypothetical protein